MTEPDDLELIRRLRHADRGVREAAFRRLFDRHRRRAFDLAWRVLGDADLAADVVQEAFVSVHLNGVRFEERAQFTSWFHRVVLNRSIDLRRRERRHRGATAIRPATEETTEDGVPSDPRSPVGTPLDQTEATERAERVRNAVDRLSPKLAEVVLLRYPRGMSYDEIGEILGVPPGTVKSRLNRAHAALRAILGPLLADDGRHTPDGSGPGGAPATES